MAKKLAFVSICMTLSVICLFGAAVTPSAKIALLAVSSVFCAIVICEYGPMYGFLHYLGVGILSLLLIPSRMYVLLYIAVLGYYPIIKLFIERLNKLWLEWILKLLLLNILLVAAYFVFQFFLLPTLNAAVAAFILKFLWWIILGIEVIFVIYDLMLSFILSYYRHKISKLFRAGRAQK